MIKLTELRTEDDKYKMSPCLVNPAHIISVTSGKLSKKGPHIIGSERERELRMIMLANSQPIFVDESVEEVFARLNPPAA